jgi:hypothetical protein
VHGEVFTVSLSLGTGNPKAPPRPREWIRPEVKAAWINALVSGDYKQGGGALRTTDGKFCALGVLCDLAARAGRGKWTKAGFLATNDEYAVTRLPDSVVTWAGLTEHEPMFATRDGGKRRLSGFNDHGFSFQKMAGMIARGPLVADEPMRKAASQETAYATQTGNDECPTEGYTRWKLEPNTLATRTRSPR